MLPFPLGDELDLGVPVVIAEDVWEATHEAACDLYDDPSTRMFTVGITGDPACNLPACYLVRDKRTRTWEVGFGGMQRGEGGLPLL